MAFEVHLKPLKLQSSPSVYNGAVCPPLGQDRTPYRQVAHPISTMVRRRASIEKSAGDGRE